MRTRTLVFILIGLVLVVPVTAGIIWLSVDGDAVRRLVEREFERQMGRKLSLGGPISLVPGWRPTVSVGGASLANASWGSQPEMLKVDRLEASLKLGPMLGGKLELWGLTLKGVDLFLERNADGVGNWVLQRPSPATTSQAAAIPPIGNVVLDGGKVAYGGGPDTPTRTVEIERAGAGPGETDAAWTVTMDAAYAGQPVQVAAAVGPSGDGWNVRNLHLKAGEAEFTGGVEIPAEGNPKVTGSLDAPEIEPLLKLANAQGSSGGGGFEALSQIDAEITAKAGRAALGGLPLRDVALTAKLQGGVLQIDPFSGRLGGGPIQGTVKIDASVSPARLDLAVDGNDVGTAEVLRNLALPVALDGRARLRARFESEGAQPQEVVASLRGNASLYAGRGRVELPESQNPVLQALAGTLLPEGAKGWGDIDCAALVTSVRGGVAKIAAAVDSTVSTVRATGTVGLASKAVDLSVVPSAKASVLSVGVPVRVTGTLDDPKVGLGEDALVEGVGATLAGLLFPPAALAVLVDLGASGTSACLAPASGQASLPDRAVSTVKGVVEGVGQDLTDQIKSLLP